MMITQLGRMFYQVYHKPKSNETNKSRCKLQTLLTHHSFLIRGKLQGSSERSNIKVEARVFFVKLAFAQAEQLH
jgi:hypothetical protein